MPTATYTGPSRGLRIKATGSRLAKDVPTEITAAEAEILADHPGVQLEQAKGEPTLEDLNREGLNKAAAEAGVEEPEKLPNKDAVIAAIREKQAGPTAD